MPLPIFAVDPDLHGPIVTLRLAGPHPQVDVDVRRKAAPEQDARCRPPKISDRKPRPSLELPGSESAVEAPASLGLLRRVLAYLSIRGLLEGHSLSSRIRPSGSCLKQSSPGELHAEELEPRNLQSLGTCRYVEPDAEECNASTSVEASSTLHSSFHFPVCGGLAC